MTEDREKTTISTPVIFIGILAVYLVPFVAVLLDEVVLRTYFVSHHAPKWLEPVFRAAYFPFFRMMGR